MNIKFSARAIQWIAIAIATVAMAAPALAQTIYENNFDQHTTAGVYTEAQLDANWNTPTFEDGVREGRVSIVRGAEAFGGSGSSLAVFYPAGEYGTKQTGAQWQLDFDQEFEEVNLTYRVKFGDGFDFVRGGKLPGLAGGSAPTGSTQATGLNGWTGRMMWRTDFEGDSGQPVQATSSAISYAKHVNSGFDQDGVNEDKIYWLNADGAQTTLQSGVWYEIKQRVKMNTPSQQDGIIQIWLDGQLVHDQQDVQFRNTSDLKIDQMYFSTFFGGGSTWATSKDEVVYFDDFKITQPETVVTKPKYLKVPQNYPTIQVAIDAANPGDFVTVRGSNVENIVVNKAITVRGYNGTKIRPADPSQPCITVTTAGATVKRFDIDGGAYGVLVENGNANVHIDYVDVHDAGVGICVQANCDNAIISKCEACENVGVGIIVSSSESVTIIDNDSDENGGDGFVVELGESAVIDGNIAKRNQGVGFSIGGNDHLLLSNKAIRNDLAGFWFTSTSQGNTVTRNKAWYNGGPGFLDDGSNNSFSSNRANDGSAP